MNGINQLFMLKSISAKPKVWTNTQIVIETACNSANSMKFDFTKKGLKIHFPKINLNIGPITNE
jgi:hypothetical protein